MAQSSGFSFLMERSFSQLDISGPKPNTTGNHNFLSFLTYAEHMGVKILPITWQSAQEAARGTAQDSARNLAQKPAIMGATSRIEQSIANIQTSLAFKCIRESEKREKSESEIYQMLINEIFVFKFGGYQDNDNLAELLGMCWDISDEKVWPVLVFEKSQFGDLADFMKQQGKSLNIKQRLSLCNDIAKSVSIMHSHKIIHGDIKPQNVLVFGEQSSTYTAKVTDFGYSTRFADVDNHIVSLPIARPWNAPELASPDQQWTVAQAKKMDIFSLAMLFLWVLFEDVLQQTTVPDKLPISLKEVGSQVPSRDHAINVLSRYKESEQLVLLAQRLIEAEQDLGRDKGSQLNDFLSLALKHDQNQRTASFDGLIEPTKLSASPRQDMEWLQESDKSRESDVLEHDEVEHDEVEHDEIENDGDGGGNDNDDESTIDGWDGFYSSEGTDDGEERFPIINDHDFGIEGYIQDFYDSDYRVRVFIAKCLEDLYSKLSTSSNPDTSAIEIVTYQLGLCYWLGFGVSRDAEKANRLLRARLPTELQDLDLEFEDFDFESFKIWNYERRRGYWLPRVLAALEDQNSIPLINFSDYYRRHGNVEQAIQYLSQESKDLTEALGSTDEITLQVESILASLLSHCGKWSQAVESLARIVNVYEKKHGAEDPIALGDMAELAIALTKQGRWKEAGTLALKVYKGHKNKFGAEDPLTLTSLSNLACIYSLQGRYDEAEKLETEALKSEEKTFGTHHPHALTSMHNLAVTYGDQGRWTEAENLLSQVLARRKEILGAAHPRTLLAMSSLATVYEAQGRSDEAEHHFVKVLKLRQEELEEDHPDTLSTMSGLACVFHSQNRYEEAEVLQKKAVEACKRVLGFEHPDTLIKLSNLASLYWEMGRREHTIEMMEMLVKSRSKAIGISHPDTLTSKDFLASCYWDMDLRDKAFETMSEVVEACTINMGAQDPVTERAANLLESWRKAIR